MPLVIKWIFKKKINVSGIKFCVKNYTGGTEIFEMLRTTFVEDCLSKAIVYQDGRNRSEMTHVSSTDESERKNLE